MTEPPYLPNNELTLADIPEPGSDWDVINGFAHRFNGYETDVPFENAYDLRDPERDRSLTEWRAILFFTARSIRHCGSGITQSELRSVWVVLRHIRNLVSNT
jgi:hypothetical protein